MKKLLIGAMAAAVSLNVSAITIEVNQTACGSGPGDSTICAALLASAKTAVGEDLPDVDMSAYAEGISNSNVVAAGGRGSDYSDNFSYFVVKPSLGVAATGVDQETPDGFAIGAGLTFGINLDLLPIDKIGPVELSKLDLFVTFMDYSVDQDDKNKNIKGDLSSFGIMARYRLIEGTAIVPGYMVEWGGVHVHTGFMTSKMKLDSTIIFNDEVFTDTTSGASGSFTDSSASFTIDSSVLVIPVEVSTYIRLAYVFTLYGGLGLDIASGSTDIDFDATGALTESTTSQFQATMTASESSDGSPEATNFRGFAGLQFNIPFVRLFAQVNKGFGNDTVGAQLGAKILW